jgi:hypothetical protein
LSLNASKYVGPAKPSAVAKGSLNDDVNARSDCVDRTGNSVIALIIGQIDNSKILCTKPIDVASLVIKSALPQYDEGGVDPAWSRAPPERHRQIQRRKVTASQ